ncbi:aminotransferase-like domain-containing protein [Lysobacter sp. A289]
MTLYQTLADDIAESIHEGLLKPGDRLQSVRQASAARKVSPATVFQAYYLLEARGLVESRPRSGYYVTRAAVMRPPEADLSSQPDGESRAVDVSDLVFQVLESSMTRDVVPLGSAFPSPLLFPLDRIGRLLASAATHLDPWSTVDDLTPGNAELRRQIALRYLLADMHVGADEIVITNGAMEALNLCIGAVTEPGDAVLVESPCFYATLQMLQRMRLRAIEVPTHPREGIDLAAMEVAIARHSPSACCLMSSFQNPLGASMPEDHKRALVELLARHRIPLVEDDVYAELYFDPQRPLPAKAFDREGLVLHCSSFSKSLAPGYRIGWAAPGRFARRVARRKLTTTLNTNVPTQAALAQYLQRGGFDRHLRRLRKTLAEQQADYLEAIARHFPRGTRVPRPAGGYFLWLELPQGADALAIQQRAAALGISIAPGPMFSASRGFGHCLRLNCGHPLDARVHSALATLGRLAG